MKSIITISIFILFLHDHAFSQGRYLVTKALISEYDSTTNTWTEPKPIALHDNSDEVLTVIHDSIYYVVTDRTNKAARANNFNPKSYTITIGLDELKLDKADQDSCYTTYTGSLMENGVRMGSNYRATVNNNTIPVEVRLSNCISIRGLGNATDKNGGLRITMQQAPLHNRPYSKWRMYLDIYRIPK